jgi:ribosomal protein L1
MNDNLNIIKNFKEWGIVDDFEETMEIAAELGYIEMVKLCKEYGAVRFDDALQAAIRFGDCDIELLQLFREWKVDVDLDKAIENVRNDDEIKDFLIEWKSA